MTTLPSPFYRAARTRAPRRPRRRRLLSVTALRLRVALHRDALDRELARGVDPTGRRQLAMRAAQLEHPRHRSALARTLRRLVDEAQARRPAARAIVPIARRQIRAHASDVLELAVRLDCPHPADPAGIAVAQLLVTDGLESPLYAADERSALSDVCRQAVLRMGDPYA